MKRFLRMYNVEQKMFLRTPDVIVFNLLMPLVTLILISLIAGSKTATGSSLTYLQSSYVPLSTVGICCSAFMSIPIASGVMAMISTLILTVAAVLVFGYRMGGNLLAYAGVWSTSPCCWS